MQQLEEAVEAAKPLITEAELHTLRTAIVANKYEQHR
jgi:hypothetical protein